MYSYGSPHMAAQKQDDQLERTFSSYVRIQAVVLKTYLGRWTIGRSGERGLGISVLPARYDDDDIHTPFPYNLTSVTYILISFTVIRMSFTCIHITITYILIFFTYIHIFIYYISYTLWKSYPKLLCPMGWGWRIYRLHLWRGVRPPQWVSWYDTKQYVG